MKKSLTRRITAAALSAAVMGLALLPPMPQISSTTTSAIAVHAAERITLADMPQEYTAAADWIWNTRVVGEGSVVSHATIYDQIIAGKGTLNYIIRWQSYQNITLQQRQQLQQVLETAINDWNQWLAGYENWPYDHVTVKIVGWAVLDQNCLLDLQPDEKVYTGVDPYDPSGDINAGMANSSMPTLMPSLPTELYRYEHWNDPGYQYPGGYENRFDMHLTASTGLIDMGGYGYYWGQQLSDNAVLGLADGTTSVHILEHEIGHGFGFTDFYGAEGASDGTPPGGFPGGRGSLMEAGSSSVITDFDGWFARYVWTKIAAEEGRFDLSDAPAATEPVPTEPTEPTGNVHDNRVMGDVNADGQFNLKDLILLQKWLLKIPGVELADWQAGDYVPDQVIDIYDLGRMKRALLSQPKPEPQVFIDAPVKDVKGFLPSQGDANLVIFYVDFPDCQYTYAPSESEIYDIAFSEEYTEDPNYPFDSMSAFYKRSSKGAMNLKGAVFRYTTKNPQAYYDENKFLITQECYEAFKDTADFSQYDGNGDGYIDVTLLTVPAEAGDDHWWPCAGPVDQDQYYVDGKRVGHIITGNAQIVSTTDYYNFNSTYLHEMGHCMGLPDYYLFTSNDSEGMHGTGGCELMDTDATTDFGAVSKLQLGWYTEQQLNIFDGSKNSVTYTLHNAQGADSNCVVIPKGDLNNFHSEYMIVEYTTKDGNNSGPAWWVNPGEGVRVYHAETSLYDHGWWVGYKYGSGSEFTNNDLGRRYLRIIDDAEKDNLYHNGDVIDNSILGFNWYDDNGNQTIDPGVTITVSEMNGDTCKVTITKK